MDGSTRLRAGFDACWETTLSPVYASIAASANDCTRVSDNPELIIGNKVEQELSEAVTLKRQLSFEEANEKYISIVTDMLQRQGVVQSRVLYSWFKVLAPATLFYEALRILMFSRLICIRLVQDSLRHGDSEAAGSHFDQQIFDQLRLFEYALTGDTADMQKYLAGIVGNPSYTLSGFERYTSSEDTFSEDIQTLKRVLKETNSQFFAFFAAGIRLHGSGWSLVNDAAQCGFDQNGDYVELGRIMPTGVFGANEESRANRAMNLLRQDAYSQS